MGESDGGKRRRGQIWEKGGEGGVRVVGSQRGCNREFKRVLFADMEGELKGGRWKRKSEGEADPQ